MMQVNLPKRGGSTRPVVEGTGPDLQMQNTEQIHRQLLDSLCEATIDPSHWVDFLTLLAKASDGDSAALALNDFKNELSSILQDFNLAPGFRS